MFKNSKESAMLALKASACAFALMTIVAQSQALSATSPNAPSSQITTQVSRSSQEQTAKKRLEILDEAVVAVGETHKALKALDGGNKKEALADLEQVTGKLEILLARDPSLQLAPIDVSETTSDIYGDMSAVQSAVETAREYLADGRTQDARHLLEHLASETVIHVTNIPLAAYPAAIKEAVRLTDAGKVDEAKQLLQTALNNLVVTQEVIPLPVVRAELMLRDAESLAENKSRSPEENKRLSDLLTNAEGQIKFAELLGYGEKDEFKKFYDEIAMIRSKTLDGKSGSGFFDKIKGYISSMKSDSQTQALAQKP